MEKNTITTQKKTIYLVKVKGHPGHGARTTDRVYAERAQEALLKQYKNVRIVTKKV